MSSGVNAAAATAGPWGAVVLLAGLLSGCGTAIEPTVPAEAANEASTESSGRQQSAARYNAEGELLRPQDHREWVFIGAPVTPNDMNDGKAAFPEFHNVYIDPASYAAYRQTGRFAEGTVILKELVSVGGKAMASGNGYFQGEFVSLEAMVKDTQRFNDEPGGWAFFRFGEAPDYSPTGARMKTADCNDCHSGASEDYVFTDTYPVLRAAKAKAGSR
ncbi:MAG: cytochrome P460 family protein [Maioricimonas sp. JB045]|uniref:cytochrome P460 family protein n=1 Tax=Maioricimonas sp. JC845 TaxID=3232138 RepID=UPI003457A495